VVVLVLFVIIVGSRCSVLSLCLVSVGSGCLGFGFIMVVVVMVRCLRMWFMNLVW